MKVVVTDGYTLNPGDLTWEVLQMPGLDFSIYDRTPADRIIERCTGAEIILSNKTIFDRSVLERLPHLRLISVLATGHNVIDGQAAREKGVIVCNVPAYGSASVAQHCIALLLAITNQVALHAASVAAGDWVRSSDWCYTLRPLTELEGKTLGIVGWGNIGSRVGALGAALGMNLVYHNPRPKSTAGAKYVTIDSLFEQSDVVSLHCPLTGSNAQFVNQGLLRLMKPSAILINTSRGQLIHEQDLADALREGRLAAAALDVLSREPPEPDSPLLSAPNCLITPHIAWITREARKRVMDITAQNLKAFLAGAPIHVVNETS